MSTKYTFQIFVDKMTMAKSKETHSTYDKVFSSLFSVQGDRSNEKYKVAQDKQRRVHGHVDASSPQLREERVHKRHLAAYQGRTVLCGKFLGQV